MGTSPSVRPLFCYSMRFLLIFVLTRAMQANSLEDSASRARAEGTFALDARRGGNVTWRDGATNEVRSAFARALQRRIRNPKQVEVHAYLSENFKGPLLIAEIVRDNGNVVEMVSASRERVGSAPLTLKLSLIWEQEPQILDVAFLNDQMFVLDIKGLTSYRRLDGQWRSVETSAIAAVPSRDPRGRIDVTKNPPAAQLPGREQCLRRAETRCRKKDGLLITHTRS